MAKCSRFRVVALAGVASVVLAACGGHQQQAHGPSEAAGQRPVGLAATDCNPAQPEPTGQPSRAPLTIGSLLAETGSLSFHGPPSFAGVEVAVAEINEAGGVLGNPVTHLRGDSGDATTDIANQTVDRHLAQGAQAIVGTTSSAVSELVMDEITGAGVVQFSPGETSAEFTCRDDNGLYFRTAPPDTLQAQALAELMARDGVRRVSILARNGPYGTGLANNLQQNLLSAGIPADQIQHIGYDPNARSFNTEVDQLREFGADGIAVIGFNESQRILTRMTDVGIGPSNSDTLVYGTDGNMGNSLGHGLPPGLLTGMRGTAPLTEIAPDFRQRLLEQNGELEDFNYAAEAYDAVITLALAAAAAQSTNGPDMATEINNVTRDGRPCTTYPDCLDLLENGQDINYDGASGPLDFTDAGEPSSGSYGVLHFNEQNRIDDSRTTYITVGR